MNNFDNCPHCGAKYLRRRVTFKRKELSSPTLIYSCGSKIPANGFWYRSDHCRLLEARRIAVTEREAHNKTREELEETKQTNATIIKGLNLYKKLKDVKTQKLLELCKELNSYTQHGSECPITIYGTGACNCELKQLREQLDQLTK